MRNTAEGRVFRLLMEKGKMAIAPELLFAELGNALWKYARIGEVEGEQVKALCMKQGVECTCFVDIGVSDGETT